MTHEYHHVCRLGHLTKEEKDVTLLDTIIMEGLAEYAVYERFGRSQTAEWTTWYTPEQLQALYEKRLRPIGISNGIIDYFPSCYSAKDISQKCLDTQLDSIL